MQLSGRGWTERSEGSPGSSGTSDPFVRAGPGTLSLTGLHHMVLSPDGTLVRIVVALGHFDESSPDQKALADDHGQPLRLPRDESPWPSREHVRWHRRNRFLVP